MLPPHVMPLTSRMLPHRCLRLIPLLAISLAGIPAFPLQGQESSQAVSEEHLSGPDSVGSSGAPDSPMEPRERKAYEKLEHAEATGDPDGLDPVKEFFESQIEAGRNVARAHNGLGRYYLQQHEHAITILESIQKLFNWDHVTQARKHFRLATEAEPRFVEAWYNWGVAGRKARDDDALREAARAFKRAVELDPTYRDAYRLLAVTLRDLGDYEGSQRVLAEWRQKGTGGAALANLEEAYVELGVHKRLEPGARLYWEGLSAARTPEEVDAFFEDMKVILSEKERKTYAELDLEGRRAWIESYWQSRADEAVVSRDEGLAEHYRRLSHVERTFSLMIPQRRHYSAISAYRPKEQSGFDDRGVIYLRHGAPDEVARFTGPNVQRNESWLYRRPERDLVFHFVSDEDTQDFKLVNSLADALVRGNATLAQRRNSSENVGELFQSRASFDQIYNRLAFQPDPMLLREEEESVARDVKQGVSTASYVPESPDSLPFFVYPAAFRGEGGDAELSFYFGVPTSELEMPQRGEEARFAYAAQVVVSDPGESGVVARAADSLAVAMRQAPPRETGVLLPDLLQTTLGAGEYRYRMRVSDLLSRKTGTSSGKVEVPDFSRFSLSSLILASRLERADGASKFQRGELKVVPLPSLRFRAGEPVFVYYEIYGLSPDGAGRVRYRTEYAIRTREKKRNIAVKVLGAVGNLIGSRKERAEEVGLTVEGEGEAAERIRENISLDLNESEPGPYELAVRVEDLSTGKKTEQTARFILTR